MNLSSPLNRYSRTELSLRSDPHFSRQKHDQSPISTSNLALSSERVWSPREIPTLGDAAPPSCALLEPSQAARTLDSSNLIDSLNPAVEHILFLLQRKQEPPTYAEAIQPVCSVLVNQMQALEYFTWTRPNTSQPNCSTKQLQSSPRTDLARETRT
jgi:hypothetical protein